MAPDRSDKDESTSANASASNSRTASTPAGDASLPPPAHSLPSSASTLPPLINQLSDLGGPQRSSKITRSVDEHVAAKALRGAKSTVASQRGDAVKLGQVAGEHTDEEGVDGASGATSDELNVVAAYKAHFREDPLAFLQQVWAYGQGSGWRGYSNYIGAPILYPGQSDAVIRDIMGSEQVRNRITRLARQRVENLLASVPPPNSTDPKQLERRQRKLDQFKQQKRQEIEAQLQDVARAMAEKSVARLDSLTFLRVFAATMNNVLVRMYHQGIHISVPQVLELRRVAAFCAERKYSIFFLPCHKSHIDYLTFSFLLFRLGLSLPHIVAGENLDMPVVGNILRGGGGFFIRRAFSGDELYPVVIKEYIEQLMAKGKNIECFIEGTRSRTGKLLPPKLGILKYVVDSILEQRTEDVYICPVSIQYDDVVEAETFVSELLGKPKEAESLFGLLSGSGSLLSLQMGRIDVRFQIPWSLKGFIKEQTKRREAPGPNGTKVELDLLNDPQHKILLLKTLGYRTLSDINRAGVVMPAALVGTVILTLRGRGVGRADLIRRVEWLRDQIIARGYQVADFGQMSTGEVVDRALTTMKDLIQVQTDVMEPTFLPLKRFELSFYRNQVIHIFVNESLLSAALYTRVKQGGSTPMQRMPLSELTRECGWISHLLRNEFVYGTDPLETNVRRYVDEMTRDEIFEQADDSTGETISDDALVGLTQKQRDLGRRDFDTYLFLVWPFIEGYWLAACSLLLLAGPETNADGSEAAASSSTTTNATTINWYAAKAFESRAQLFGKTMYSQGELSYLEAVSAQTISQAMARYEELGIVIRRKSSAAKPVPLIALDPAYKPRLVHAQAQNGDAATTSIAPGGGGKLWKFLERLNSFRREGKDRRDAGDVVGERLLDVIGRNYPTPVETTRHSEGHARI